MVAPLWVLVLPEKGTKVHQKKFLGDATPKTSRRAKFHRDRSNPLEKSIKSVNFSVPPDIFFVTDGQKREYSTKNMPHWTVVPNESSSVFSSASAALLDCKEAKSYFPLIR